MRSSQTDVLIIGAGPSGLMAGQALARLGVKILIVDRRLVGTQYGNADGLQPRTLEIWQSYGMLDKISPKSAAMHAMVSYEQDVEGKGLVRSTPSRNIVVTCRYPFELTASIDTIEQTLRMSLEAAGARLVQPVSPLSINILTEEPGITEELTHPIRVVLNHLNHEQAYPASHELDTTGNGNSTEFGSEIEEVSAKYVIGADGAYSWVRRQLGIQMEGDQTEYVWGVADVIVNTNFPDLRFKCIVQSSTGAIIIIPREEEKIRIYVQLSAQDIVKTQDGRLDKSALSPESIRAKVLSRAKVGLEPYLLEFRQVFWCTIFSVPQKVATHFSFRDRIFIVGDACHTHSPKAGQGANASMGDSHNLAWKIAYVLKGWAKTSLLDTYEVERRAYAQDLIELDKHIVKSLNDGTGTAAEYQHTIHQQNMFTSGIGVFYRSRLTDDGGNRYAVHLKAGERLPPSRLVRLADWHPMELQDLTPSDGLFKIFVLPCDIRIPDQTARLTQFSAALSLYAGPPETERISSFVIVNNSEEDVHWKNVPLPLQSWKRVFVSELGENGLYCKFGISSAGAAILVRPDGYISMLAELSDVGAGKIIAFLQDL
ncbi:FAD binding domain-containing protein [Gautieria morchelliformis]|nr:FAD binding domain-containing protein [Gautieria morchelliformis]